MFFSVKNFHYKTFFQYKIFFSANNVYFVKKHEYFLEKIFFNLVLQRMNNHICMVRYESNICICMSIKRK